MTQRMARQRSSVDFTVERPGHAVWLLVEARNTLAPSREWAAEVLRNLFEYADPPPSEYFLLVLRNRMYLWRRPTRDAAEPDFEGSTAEALQPYLSRLSYPLEKLYPVSFQMLIESWLNDLAAGDPPDDANRSWLEESGLAESIRDASICANTSA
jgi:hypothetical protein